MTDTNKMREQFEAWACNKFKINPKALQAVRWEDGYSPAELEQAWLGWQASREAVEIEFPSVQCININEYTTLEAVMVCRSAIESQGLKVAK